jgi:hypothetical protein
LGLAASDFGPKHQQARSKDCVIDEGLARFHKQRQVFLYDEWHAMISVLNDKCETPHLSFNVKWSVM